MNGIAPLLDAKVILVTGKGGTGKTTFAAALAVLAAARGRKVVLCEVDNQRPSMSAIFQVVPPFEPVEVRPRLKLCNIHWDDALVSYLRTMIPSRRAVQAILDNKVIGRFLNFLPGAREIVTLSRIERLTHEADLVVVDMPASGHAFSLLDVTRSAMGLFRSGPVRERASQLVDGLILSPHTHLAFVGLPEEMVVNETIETLNRMKSHNLLGGAPWVFLNRATLPSLSEPERALLGELAQRGLSAEGREFVRAGLWEDRLEQATGHSQARLREEIGVDPVLVPPTGAGGVPREVVTGIAAFLGRQVGLTRQEVAWS
jgi:anion-transporting  ArsA/GET3 family ATPase